MIGNDIVDLKVAALQSNWKRVGYLNKIFTDFEQQLIFTSKSQNNQVWSLWTRKESVYKILIQLGIKKGFYPKKIECFDDHLNLGIVKYKNILFFTKTLISDNYIYSIAVLNKADLKKSKEILWDKNCTTVNKIPYYKMNNKLVSISKTHHGSYEKIVCLNF